MQKLLTLQDLIAILQVSEPTIRRWLAESRKGTGSFPKSVNGYKRKLLFRPEDIEVWAAAGRPPPVAIESASSRAKRNDAAMSALRKKGVGVKQWNQKKQDRKS